MTTGSPARTPGLNFRHYEALYWIGRLGSFHAAARQLGTSQAAISLRIRELERQLGLTLFERMRDGVRPTPKGTELLAVAAGIIALAAEVQRIGGDTALSGRVRLGATGIHAATWLPTLLHQVEAEAPSIRIEVVIDSSEPLHELIGQGRLDLAVMAGPVADPRLLAEPVGRIENIWVAAPGRAPPACSVAELARLPIISDRTGTRLHAAVLAWFRADGVEPRQPHGASHLQARLALAQAGNGVALAARAAAMRLVRAGALIVVDTGRPPPALDYVLASAELRLAPPVQFVADRVRTLIARKPDLDAYFAEASITRR